MRILNADNIPKFKIRSGVEPQAIQFTVRDKSFVFDCNSLRLAEVDSKEEAERVEKDSVDWTPSFPPHSGYPRYVVLEACHACQFRCSYCSVQAYYPGADMMNLETAKEAIHYFFPRKEVLVKDPKAQVGFFGGEPLLNWNLMTEVTTYFEGLCYPRRPHFHVTTNGALIDEAKAAFLCAHDYSFIVSLDGPQGVHDMNRYYKDGSGTFDDVMKGLTVLRRAGLSNRVTLRATFTPSSTQTLRDRAVFLNGLVQEGYARNVSIEPAFLTESLCGAPEVAKEGITEDDMQALSLEYERVGMWFVTEVRAGRQPIFFNIGKLIERLLWTIHSATDCGGGVGYFSVNADGDIGACHREQSSYIGNLSKGGIDEALRAKWLDNRLYLREGCTECPIRFVCGGGCRERSIGEHNNIRKPVKSECDIKFLFFRTAAWIMAELGPEALKNIIPQPMAARKITSKSGQPSDCDGCSEKTPIGHGRPLLTERNQ